MERNLREDKEHCHLVAILRNCRCLQEEGGHSESEVLLLAILWQGLAHSAQHLAVLVQECLFDVSSSFPSSTRHTECCHSGARRLCLVLLLFLHSLARAGSGNTRLIA